LRTPANVFIINLTICDFFACCLHPLAVYSSFRGRWSFGQTGRENVICYSIVLLMSNKRKAILC
jgi:hypothetical protein